MKKIFLLMTIMTSLFFALSIKSNAYTFNGSYDFSNIDLNAPISELNGASLNNLFNYDYFEHLYLAELPNGIRSKFELDGNEVVFNQYIQEYVLQSSDIVALNSGTNVDFVDFNRSALINNYVGSSVSPALVLNTSIMIDFDEYDGNNFDDISNVDTYSFRTSTTKVTFIVEKNLYTNLSQAQDDLKGTKIYYQLSTPIQNLDIIQSLYFYNLENINIDLLNYYFAVWLLNVFNLPVGDLWSYAWTAGNDSGYNDGFTDGYDSGYTSGFDTGNLQGYTSGYDFGYNNGFDDGLISEVDTQWLLGFVTGTINILGVSIIPGISLGVFVFIPLFLGFIGFIFRLGGRRG